MARRDTTEIPTWAVAPEMVEAIAEFYDDPEGFVLFAFPWGEEGTPLANEEGPDEWQLTMLRRLGREIQRRNVNEALPAILMAAASGHGVGKTAFVAWIIIWFSSTRSDPAIVVTANTLGQLSGKTWRELAKWHRLSINASWFTWTATTFYLKTRQETHRARAVPWTKESSEGFAGTHEKHVLMIFDEASAIPDSLWEVTEGALTTSGAIWLVFGNPTRNTGRFRECFRRFRHRWIPVQVDSRTARKANLSQLQTWVDDYGEDSDFVRVRVKGEFPRSASSQLIPMDLVETAREMWRRRVPVERLKRALAEGPESVAALAGKLDLNPNAARVLSCDVARKGSDQTVIGMRVGNTFVALEKHRGLDNVQVAFRLIAWIKALEPDATVVDGAGVGTGVIDTLTHQGYEVTTYVGAFKAMDLRQYFNRRTEMWVRVKRWLAEGGAIPDDDQELFDDLTGPEYGYAQKDQIQLETKEDMAARGLPSPDTGDCLVMSFAVDPAPRMSGRVETVAQRLAGIAYGGGAEGATSWMST